MKHLQFVFLFIGIIVLHLSLKKIEPKDGWQRMSSPEYSTTSSEQPVIYYASLNPEIRQIKWRCLSGELRIKKIEIRTSHGGTQVYSLSPQVLHAGLTTRPLEISKMDGKLESVTLWYDSASNLPDGGLAKVELLGIKKSDALLP